MKRFFLCNILCLFALSIIAQTAHVKNVIVMIPDGTSTSLLSAARWYQTYMDSSKSSLNIDPFLTGLVRTNSSDAPIGDSAPTTSCYMTGQPTQTAFVSTYPVKTDHDLVPIDETRAYQPQATLLEYAKRQQEKSTGLVFTCNFPHATPADCAAHTYDRGDAEGIAKQMVYNKVDVVIGGGVSYLKEPEQSFLKENGYNIYLDDVKGLRSCQSAPCWALFEPYAMPYDMERDTTKLPSLAEMTQKAIELLSSNPNGFFMMVEGSKVDWAAHDNDAKAAITDFLAFDQACKVALDFAQKDGNTLVLIAPDHGTSALTVGNAKSNHGYDKLSLKQIMQTVDDYKISIATMTEKMNKVEPTDWPALFKTNFNIDVDEAEVAYLKTAHDYKKSDLPKEQRAQLSLSKMLSQVLYGRTYFGFTTFGHTMENVFLAVYHPKGDVLSGCPTNIEVNQYLCKQMGMTEPLRDLSDELFVDHRKVFADYQYQIDSISPSQYRLTAKYKKNTLVVDSYTSYVTVNKKRYDLSSVVVYMPKNKTLYVPKELYKYLLLK
ncbi:MAG: alkaline phosphatase [Bacteroidales bacterium]|nr:alkaline phosphatase [Bacteroidales bacterium]